MNQRKFVNAIAATLLLLGSGMANAGVYDFHLSGKVTGDWQIASSPTPEQPFSDDSGSGFIVSNVTVTEPGSASSQARFDFFGTVPGAVFGGFAVTGGPTGFDGLNLFGPSLFKGSPSAPTFLLGNFELLSEGVPSYSLSITDPNAVTVPEPAPLALLGLGLVGFIATRRKPMN